MSDELFLLFNYSELKNWEINMNQNNKKDWLQTLYNWADEFEISEEEN